MNHRTHSARGRGLAARAFLLLVSALLASLAWLTHRYGPGMPGAVWLPGGLAGAIALFAIAAPLRWVRFLMSLDLLTQDMADR